MATVSEIIYRKSNENSDNEMDVDMELKMDGEGTMLVVKSPKAVKGRKVGRPSKSPKVAVRTSPRIVNIQKTDAIKKDGVKKVAMKTKAKADESNSKGMKTAGMVVEALESLKSRKGITMPSIHSYLSKYYGVHSSKKSKKSIKNILKELFEAGEVGNMEPSKDGDLKFNSRIWYKPNK